MVSRRLQVFLAVAETGSFSKAAQKMFITPSAVVQQMNAMEADLNCCLMERSSKGIRLTEAGELLLRQGSKFVQDSEELRRELESKGKPDNTIRFGTHMLYKGNCLKQMWPGFHEQYPNIELDIRYSSFFEKELMGLDLVEGADFIGEQSKEREWLYLGSTPLVMLVCRSHPLAGETVVSMEQLLPYKVVSIGMDERMSEIVRRFNDNTRNAGISIEEVPYYDQPLFDRCELEMLALQIPLCWAGLAPDMIPIRLKESYRLPYGFLYSSKCSKATLKFLNYVKERRTSFDFLSPL